MKEEPQVSVEGSKVKKEKIKKEKTKKEKVNKEKVEKSKGADKLTVGNFISEMDSKFEQFAFGGVAGKLKVVSKVLMYLFILFGFFGLILTAMLTSSLGVVGVLVALFLVCVFIFVGYTISALLYGFGHAIENSEKSKSDLGSVILQSATTAQIQKQDAEIQIDNEFPEF